MDRSFGQHISDENLNYTSEQVEQIQNIPSKSRGINLELK
jgi:hypothetical protein